LDIFEGVTTCEISENEIKNGLDIIKSLSETSGFLSSNSEARRALKENSISVNKTKVNESYKLTNADLINNKYIVLNRGKKKTFIIKVK
jgi:tyrosyl-tRNA synthetase